MLIEIARDTYVSANHVAAIERSDTGAGCRVIVQGKVIQSKFTEKELAQKINGCLNTEKGRSAFERGR